jgi:hypothetical protein
MLVTYNVNKKLTNRSIVSEIIPTDFFFYILLIYLKIQKHNYLKKNVWVVSVYIIRSKIKYDLSQTILSCVYVICLKNKIK